MPSGVLSSNGGWKQGAKNRGNGVSKRNALRDSHAFPRALVLTCQPNPTGPHNPQINPKKSQFIPISTTSNAHHLLKRGHHLLPRATGLRSVCSASQPSNSMLHSRPTQNPSRGFDAERPNFLHPSVPLMRLHKSSVRATEQRYRHRQVIVHCYLGGCQETDPCPQRQQFVRRDQSLLRRTLEIQSSKSSFNSRVRFGFSKEMSWVSDGSCNKS